MLEIPIPTSIFIQAGIDAYKRRRHTENWTLKTRKGRDPYQFMMIGNLGEFTFYDYCKNRGFPVRLLQSSYSRPDQGDIILFSWRGDIKTAARKLRAQIHKPQRTTEFYVFCVVPISESPTYNEILQVHGWLPRREALQDKFRITLGQKIPGESFRQGFDESWFPYPPSVLRDIQELFDKGVHKQSLYPDSGDHL